MISLFEQNKLENLRCKISVNQSIKNAVLGQKYYISVTVLYVMIESLTANNKFVKCASPPPFTILMDYTFSLYSFRCNFHGSLGSTSRMCTSR